MEEIASKFSLYDFFNPIFCGCMVVVGLHLMGCSPILYIIDSINTSGYEILNWVPFAQRENDLVESNDPEHPAQ